MASVMTMMMVVMLDFPVIPTVISTVIISSSVIITAIPSPSGISISIEARGVHVVIPVVLNEIDRHSASTISVAMFMPVFPVAWRHMQVNRLGSYWHWLDNDWCRVENWRTRVISDVDPSIHARLIDADGYSNPNIGSPCRNRENGNCCCE